MVEKYCVFWVNLILLYWKKVIYDIFIAGELDTNLRFLPSYYSNKSIRTSTIYFIT